jgi:predicted thioesterase
MMADLSLQPGLAHEASYTVSEAHLASRWGSGLADVLATPALVAFCEACAVAAVDHLLPPGQQTVGTSITIKHLAPTPPGMAVTVKVELVEVDGRRLRFTVEAWDAVERVAEADHERFVIDTARFGARVSEKVAQSQPVTSDQEGNT